MKIPFPRRPAVSGALLAAPLVVAGLGLAAPALGGDVFLARFDGEWSGTGHVQPNAESAVHQVTCRTTGTSSPTALSVKGTCSAYLVFTREVAVDVRLDPVTGRYTGTYVGSPAGPAALSGVRSGNTLRLDIAWPKEINGDRTAHLAITSLGEGRFELTLTDQLEPGGPRETTTRLRFAKG